MASASACDNRMPGKTRHAHEKLQLCSKPAIMAIIQLDLICIIKLCYCLALEAIAGLYSYNKIPTMTQDKETVKEEPALI